jgi:hypothetical protein
MPKRLNLPIAYDGNSFIVSTHFKACQYIPTRMKTIPSAFEGSDYRRGFQPLTILILVGVGGSHKAVFDMYKFQQPHAELNRITTND